MAFVFWLLVCVGGALALAYRRATLRQATIAASFLLGAYLLFANGSWLWNLICAGTVGALWALNMEDLRRDRVIRPLLSHFRRILPNMSDTEQAALDAGTVWWDGELFSGAPDWNQLLSVPAPTLSDEEQAFLDGPVEQLCGMLDDWEITHERADLPPHIWQFLKDQGFFAMIIEKKYGGKEFSALAHSSVLAKVAGRSATCSSIIAVPNSLGPAELLHKYGTEEQKDYYLPRLARGEEIPCFGLTSPRAGSDATSLTDSGVVTRGMWDGEEVLGLRLNWDKRYITLAPVATVLGLAFRMYDPDGLLGDQQDLGLTCALIPMDLPGVTHGRRHFPLNVPFQNGPTQGKDVFIPLEAIIGGVENAGQGWRMLVECLSVGRCISLPSSAAGGGVAAVGVTGAYARVRRQFGMPIGRFEGVEEVIARMAGRAYAMEATRVMTAGAVDLGEAPAVPSAIVKYHLTEMGRDMANDAMDVHGGKAIMLGPKNYLARGYQAVPIAITVEGANILTRSMIIYGQGAIRCHPWVLRELEAARDEDTERGLLAFDTALLGHIGYTLSSAARAFVSGLSRSRFVDVPVAGPTRRYYQHVNRFAAAFALVSDVCMLTLGGKLKKKESISSRLGDVLSYMYLVSAVLKRYEDQGRPEADLPLVEWACRDLLYKCQEQLHGILRNFPNRFVATALRLLVFPTGRGYSAPSDRLGHRIASLMIHDTQSRSRLIANQYQGEQGGNALAQLNEVLTLADMAEPLEKRIRRAVKDGVIVEGPLEDMISAANTADILNDAEARQLRDYDRKVMRIIAVDDFESSEMAAGDISERDTREAPRLVS